MLIHGLNLLSVYPHWWNLTSARSIARRDWKVSYLFLFFLAPSTELGHIVGVHQLFDIKGQEVFRAIYFLFFYLQRDLLLLPWKNLTVSNAHHSAWHLVSMQ